MGCGGKVDITSGEQVEDTGLEIDVLYWHPLIALRVGSLQCVARPGLHQGGARQAVPQNGRHLALPIIDAFT